MAGRFTLARHPCLSNPTSGRTIDPARTQAAITSRTKAIIAVHLYGQPAEMNALNEIAAPRGIKVIEDAAQAHGARY
jgi:dTDP-3-amino-3,4,6-trideoxy-alpha-D-glucose transaminase